MTQVAQKPNQVESSRLRHQFTVAEFEKAYFAGTFGQKRLELIEGEIYEMAPMGDAHVSWIGRFTMKLTKALGDVAMVLPQVPILLEENDSQPEPDFVIVKLEAYQNRKARASETAIVIEISDSTLEDDRDVKQKLYARNGVREYWILNVQTNELEVYREPQGETYKTKFTLASGQGVTPLEFPNVTLEWWV